jgi:hypothetical protein
MKSLKEVDRSFCWLYFGGRGEDIQQDAREHLYDLNFWRQRGSPSNLETAAQVLFRYRLLDILSSVLGAPKHQSWVAVHSIPPPELSERLDRVTCFVTSHYH